MGSINACFPNYGVLLTFRTDQRPVRVALCFECDMLAVFDGDSPDRINRQEAMNTPTQLVMFAKAIFSNDTEIQALKPRRFRP